MEIDYELFNKNFASYKFSFYMIIFFWLEVMLYNFMCCSNETEQFPNLTLAFCFNDTKYARMFQITKKLPKDETAIFP